VKNFAKRFTTELILVALDLNKQTRMEMDISDHVTGGVLFIECIDRR